MLKKTNKQKNKWHIFPTAGLKVWTALIDSAWHEGSEKFSLRLCVCWAHYENHNCSFCSTSLCSHSVVSFIWTWEKGQNMVEVVPTSVKVIPLQYFDGTEQEAVERGLRSSVSFFKPLSALVSISWVQTRCSWRTRWCSVDRREKNHQPL